MHVARHGHGGQDVAVGPLALRAHPRRRGIGRQAPRRGPCSGARVQRRRRRRGGRERDKVVPLGHLPRTHPLDVSHHSAQRAGETSAHERTGAGAIARFGCSGVGVGAGVAWREAGVPGVDSGRRACCVGRTWRWTGSVAGAALPAADRAARRAAFLAAFDDADAGACAALAGLGKAGDRAVEGAGDHAEGTPLGKGCRADEGAGDAVEDAALGKGRMADEGAGDAVEDAALGTGRMAEEEEEEEAGKGRMAGEAVDEAAALEKGRMAGREAVEEAASLEKGRMAGEAVEEAALDGDSAEGNAGREPPFLISGTGFSDGDAAEDAFPGGAARCGVSRSREGKAAGDTADGRKAFALRPIFGLENTPSRPYMSFACMAGPAWYRLARAAQLGAANTSTRRHFMGGAAARPDCILALHAQKNHTYAAHVDRCVHLACMHTYTSSSCGSAPPTTPCMHACRPQVLGGPSCICAQSKRSEGNKEKAMQVDR